MLESNITNINRLRGRVITVIWSNMTHWEQNCKKSVNSITENILPLPTAKGHEVHCFSFPLLKNKCYIQKAVLI